MNQSVIDLAQLLTQALDENFNIRNQSAVVKVVTCLEAFKITHESYREVQNTRIIKDLQALRQNKANDQVLAKRIKNLLRKWKERLASTIPSQPNSPQNISQGSSDTQFMTQQSQSPPNSQPPRLVNGPTSFKNLLPKSQNHYQTVTSPVSQKTHQNGINDSSLSQQKVGGIQLGKRKMPSSNTLDGISNASGDIDENSNHNRKSKMMKKSEFGNSSSLILNANNSNSNQQINNKLHSNVPVTLQQQQTNKSQQSQQTIPKVEEPKKRGRRKGSKGFDSTLNGAIPDFQAEIQQKIALSAGKRNKTTFELQQMLESHQSTNASWTTNGDIHDSNSLDRVNSVASSYHTVEPVYSAFDNLSRVKKEVTDVKRELTDVENPILPDDSKISSLTAKNELASSSVRSLEDEISKIYSMLPPIDYEAALRARFDDLSTYDENGELVECTCTFREVITYEDGEEQESKETNGFDEAKLNSKVNINGDNKNNVSKKPENDSEISENDDDDDETDDFCAVEDIIVEKSPPRSAVKSIFDPEYDANENLIEEMMVRRKPTRDALPKIIEVKIEKDAVKSSRIESMINSSTTIPEPASIQQMERVPIITYECDENPMCPAREHFQRDPVTKRNVQQLHNSFLNGINGYWNGILEERQEPDYSKDNENIDYAKHQLWKRVVPRYNFLTLDKIPKTFAADSLLSIPPPPPPPESSENKAESNSDTTKDSKKSVSFDDAMELDCVNNFSMHKHRDIEFREWHEVMNVRSYNDEVLTILPYVVID